MGVTVLAAGGAAYVAGELAFALGVPLIGLTCLLIGLRERSRSRKRPRPGYPYPPGPPPGYLGPYPGHPYAGYPPRAAPPPRASGSSTTLIAIGAVVLVLGLVGDFASAASGLAKKSGTRTEPQAEPQMGQCFTEFDLRLEFHNRSPTDCADPNATYQLVARGGPTATCPDGRREDSVYEVFSNESSTLCFAANLKQGQCYMKMDDGKSKKLTPADCDDRRFAQVKVVQRIDGSTDKTQCPADAKGVSYPVPPRVYCVVAAGP
ncbi:hypothetical protein OK015_28100 [Mycobacterium sp. Aquia_216]|uniref:LppU/SCO3897 family protein n=1 Tax=Mycobacterium sp. Aquia_216 TaxID=2991729 RepID=UPI00227A91E5|nr:hypothetical protein [Mycobacterium sp. Aquia_216]WAJ44901.1 hypothetical protein OK015_28100 [Mycobacterium sp. Aquia_216]